jgi:hypothetical protein
MTMTWTSIMTNSLIDKTRNDIEINVLEAGSKTHDILAALLNNWSPTNGTRKVLARLIKPILSSPSWRLFANDDMALNVNLRRPTQSGRSCLVQIISYRVSSTQICFKLYLGHKYVLVQLTRKEERKKMNKQQGFFFSDQWCCSECGCLSYIFKANAAGSWGSQE